jgi:hypothetical protein
MNWKGYGAENLCVHASAVSDLGQFLVLRIGGQTCQKKNDPHLFLHLEYSRGHTCFCYSHGRTLEQLAILQPNNKRSGTTC